MFRSLVDQVDVEPGGAEVDEPLGEGSDGDLEALEVAVGLPRRAVGHGYLVLAASFEVFEGGGAVYSLRLVRLQRDAGAVVNQPSLKENDQLFRLVFRVDQQAFEVVHLERLQRLIRLLMDRRLLQAWWGLGFGV